MRHVSLNWTVAQKADLQNYRPGQLLGFHRAVKSFAKHETVEVLGVAQKGIVVRSAEGKESTISKRHAGSFDVLEAKPIEVSPGDRLLLTGNRRDAGLRVTNGELVTVSGLDASVGFNWKMAANCPPTTAVSRTATLSPRIAAKARRLTRSFCRATACKRNCFMLLPRAAGTSSQ